MNDDIRVTVRTLRGLLGETRVYIASDTQGFSKEGATPQDARYGLKAYRAIIARAASADKPGLNNALAKVLK